MTSQTTTKQRRGLVRLVAAQLACAAILIVEFGFDLLDKRLPFLTWRAHEALEILEVISAAILIGLTLLIFRQQRNQLDSQERQIRGLTLDFSVLIGESLAEQNLTKSEREVAWLSIKGYANKEIAELRGVGEPTIKKQMSAIYEKYSVASRSEFLSELLDKVLDAR